MKGCNLWIHDERFSKMELIIHPDAVPGIRVGDVVEITQMNPSSVSGAHFRTFPEKKNRLIIQVTDLDLDIIARQPQLQISLNQQIASIFDLQPRKDVIVSKIDPASVAADYVELSFRDQYIGRGDMFRLKHFLLNSCVYSGKKLLFAGCIRAQVKEIYAAGNIMTSAYITQQTKMIFRSESAKYFLFIHLCEEMFKFDDTANELYFEKAVLGFLPDLFNRWKSIGANHVVSIVLFARVMYDEQDMQKYDLETDPCVMRREISDDIAGFKDFYKVVIDWETRQDWNVTLPLVKQEMYIFHRKVLERQIGSEVNAIAGRLSPAYLGNVLESVNLALNIFDKHYIDRDLLRTGLSIVVISPMHGIIETDRDLLHLTAERMIEDGIGLDLVCLNKPPLYVAPLFRFKVESENLVAGSNAEVYDPRFDEYFDPNAEWRYNIPHWIDLSFYHACNYFRNQEILHRIHLKPALVPTSRTKKLTIGVPPLNMENLDMEKYCRNVSASPNIGNSSQNVTTPIKSSAAGLLTQHFHRDFPPSKSSSPELSFSPSRSIQKEISVGQEDAKNDQYLGDPNVSPPRYISASNPIVIRKHGSEKRDTEDMSRMSLRFTSANSYGKSFGRTKLTNSPGRENKPTVPGSFILGSGLQPRQHSLVVNPCNPSQNLAKMSSHLRRWHHIFPRLLNKKKVQLVKWISLCTPACLPLTTDYFPTIQELAELYQEYTYTVSLNDEITNMMQSRTINSLDTQKRTENLLMELIAQRLIQGFQLVVGNQTALSEQGQVSRKTKPISSTGGQAFPFSVTSPSAIKYLDSAARISNTSSVTSLTAPIYLSMGHQVHRLMYDPLAQNVEVKRYVRNSNFADRKSVEYVCAMWPKDRSQFIVRRASFSYPESADYNWNYLDHIVSGYQEELTDSLRFWKTRFILIPMESVASSTLLNPSEESLTDEEVRLAGFTKFIELFHRARWTSGEKSDHSKPGAISSGNIPITFTTLNNSMYIKNEFRKWKSGETIDTESPARKQQPSVPERLTKDTKFNNIVLNMLNPQSGLEMKDRRWHLRYYESVFVGSECVDWLVKTFSDINTREEATEFGNMLLSQGVFEHVNSRHRFLDGHYFYRIKREYLTATGPKSNTESATGWFRKQSTSGDSRKEFQKIELTRKMVIDLDPQNRSYRRELAVLHYDAIHNPKNCYHFSLHWLVCTARLVEDLLQSWGRFAERCGLRLIEAPVEQVKLDDGDDNPFQSPIEIFLVVQPPTIERKESVEIPEVFFETALLRYFGFVLDIESDDRFQSEQVIHSFLRQPYKYTQYVHRSGAAFVQIREPGNGFLWVNNRLLTSHSQSVGGTKLSQPLPDVLRREFQQLCGNKEWLDGFWSETMNQLNISTLMEELTDERIISVDNTPGIKR